MGKGNNDVGRNSPTRKNGKPVIERAKGSSLSDAGTVKQMKAGQPSDTRAMSQQGSFSNHLSSPQQLLRLVGCRDQKSGVGPRVRPESKQR